MQPHSPTPRPDYPQYPPYHVSEKDPEEKHRDSLGILILIFIGCIFLSQLAVPAFNLLKMQLSSFNYIWVFFTCFNVLRSSVLVILGFRFRDSTMKLVIVGMAIATIIIQVYNFIRWNPFMD